MSSSLLSLQIVKGNDPALFQRAAEVPHGADVGTLIACMELAMINGRGVGLAANQIGVLQRVIVVHADGFKQAFINPVITKRCGGKHTAKEGCLSFPGLQVLSVRDKQIVVEGFDRNWKPIKFKLRGLAARCVQHEIDHLDGVTIAGNAAGVSA